MISNSKKIAYLLPAPDMDRRCLSQIKVPGYKNIVLDYPQINRENTVARTLEVISRQCTEHNALLISFCFSGLWALELGKMHSFEKVIVVSGILRREELGRVRMGMLQMFIWTPSSVLKVLGWLLGRVSKLPEVRRYKIPRLWLKLEQNKALARHVLGFDGRPSTVPIRRIHGKLDQVIPYTDFQVDYLMPDGGHYLFIHNVMDLNLCLAEIGSQH
jgi:hypothetical protein